MSKTKDYDNKVITVDTIGEPSKIGMYRCRRDNGNIIRRHESRLEFMPFDQDVAPIEGEQQ